MFLLHGDWIQLSGGKGWHFLPGDELGPFPGVFSAPLLCPREQLTALWCIPSPAALVVSHSKSQQLCKCLWQSLEGCHGAVVLSRYHRRHSLLSQHICSLSYGNMINLIISESVRCGKWWSAIWLLENESNVSVWCKKCFWMGEWIMHHDS